MIGLLHTAAAPMLVLFATVIAICVGDVVAVRRGIDAGWRLWTLAAGGLVAARLSYVFQFRLAYFEEPWRMLDVLDAGWSSEGGFVGLWLMSIWMVRRQAAFKQPIRAAVVSGTLLWGFGAVALEMQQSESTGIELPSLILVSDSGVPIDLRTLRGKPTVVNLWATWCPPCNREMPILARAQAEHPEMNFVFIDQGETLMQVGGWISEHQLTLHDVLLDPHLHAGAALGQRAFPTSYFFNADGRLVDTRIGGLSPTLLSETLRKIATDLHSATNQPVTPGRR